MVAYVASKFAVRGMTKVAALELAASGIRVNSVHPGGIKHADGRRTGVRRARYRGDDRPADPRWAGSASPTRWRELALFLASDASSYCTGAEFVIDGGVTCGVAVEAINQGLQRHN